MTNYNFGAGPALLPEPVITQAKIDILEWNNTKQSILEIGHRSKEIEELFSKVEKDLREVLVIPSTYRILFLPGGASFQFAMIPINLIGAYDVIDCFDTGFWSQRAIAEARKVARVNIVASSSPTNYASIPEPSEWRCSENAAYCHYTSNETIGGIEFDKAPELTNGTPLVADMSSNILSTPLDVSAFGLIYASAQKNLGIAGLSIVIIREDLLARAPDNLPDISTFRTHAKHLSLYNTPPIVCVYVTGLILGWIKSQGGLQAMHNSRIKKSKKLYDMIDSSEFYSNRIDKRYRSKMNIPFRLPNESLEKLFLENASAQGLLNLQGHRSMGGVRASLYNAMPEQGVDALISFMTEFQKKYA